MASAASFLIRRGFGRVPEELVPIDTGSGGGGGGGMGGDVVYHTEYRDKPLPIIRIHLMDEDQDKKEIIITNLKDFDSL